MFIRDRYDIILGKPGRVTETPEVKSPPDVSFLSDNEFIEFIQGEIKRREKDNIIFRGVFINREQAEADANGLSYAPGVYGITGIRGYAGITGYQGSTNIQGNAQDNVSI
jgi:hypothetical protein